MMRQLQVGMSSGIRPIFQFKINLYLLVGLLCWSTSTLARPSNHRIRPARDGSDTTLSRVGTPSALSKSSWLTPPAAYFVNNRQQMPATKTHLLMWKLQQLGGQSTEMRHTLHLLNDSSTLCNDGTPAGDLWTGKRIDRRGDFYFHGSRIIQKVIDVLPWQEYSKVERIIFAGSSAGGIGLFLNLDRLRNRLVKRMGYPILISGLVDSAWFIHMPAYQQHSGCHSAYDCPAEERIQRGIRYWKARIPKACRKEHPPGHRWKCYLAPYIYQHIKTPIFVVQSLFDEAQMQMSKVPLLSGGGYEKWAYIQKLGRKVADSLRNVRGVFAPSCIDHEILTKNDWIHKTIDSVGLVDALMAWDNELARKWTEWRIWLWSIQNPQALLAFKNHYISSRAINHNAGQPVKLQFTRNSTLLFLFNLVSMLNHRMASKSVRPLSTASKSINIHNDDKWQPDSSYGLSKADLVAQQSSKTRRAVEQSNYLYYSPKGYLEHLFDSPPSSETVSSKPYHIIDSCGLLSNQNSNHLCAQTRESNVKFGDQLSYLKHMNNPLPQCNPTCGFISNPHRMKLVDVLALYDVNTDLLATILGIKVELLRNMDSNQQMRLLFCGTGR